MSAPRIGTSGWSYPSGAGTWNGIFYPSRRGRGNRRSSFDELAYYAEHFDTVEVNSSFYRLPDPGVARSWARRTPADFTFSLKLYQKFTHPAMFAAATGAEACPDPSDVAGFRSALDPIASAGKLAAVLAQFPPSFKSDNASREYLSWLLDAFVDYPVAVELRHRSWSDDTERTSRLLGQFGSAWVQIDEPKFHFSIQQSHQPNVPGFYYMRLHGRNADAWWHHDRPEQRYDYLYTPTELRPIAETVATARRRVGQVYLYLNNHFAAKSVANAVQLKRALELPAPGVYPNSFVTRYPELEGIVATEIPLLPLRTSP